MPRARAEDAYLWRGHLCLDSAIPLFVVEPYNEEMDHGAFSLPSLVAYKYVLPSLLKVSGENVHKIDIINTRIAEFMMMST